MEVVRPTVSAAPQAGRKLRREILHRKAEQIALLDVMSGGRCVFGFGRGAASVEYAGFRIPMEEARARFVISGSYAVYPSNVLKLRARPARPPSGCANGSRDARRPAVAPGCWPARSRRRRREWRAVPR